MIPTFIGITVLVFTILQIVPGGPFEQELLRFKMAAMAGSEGGAGSSGGSEVGMVDIPEEALQKLKEYYGLKKNLKVIRLSFFKSADETEGLKNLAVFP